MTMIADIPITLAQEGLKKYFFFSTGASSQATETENLFMYIIWVNILSFAMLMALLGWFILKYRRSKQTANYQVSPAHHTPLELAWSIIPLLIMVPIFYYGFTGYADKLAAPADAEEIMVTGEKWKWSVTYANGAEPQGDPVYLTETRIPSVEFVVPVHRPVKLIMNSRDVIHAFYIPDFRTKMDVIPNRYTSMWFYPEKETNERDRTTGRLRDPSQAENPPHKVFCAEYCGQNHSEMMAQLRVVSQEAYRETIRKWTDYRQDVTILKVGQLVYNRKGCNACHSVDGTASTGPTWKNMFGARHEYTNGTTDTVTENTLRDDILYSQKRILKGYPTSMPIFAGQISPLEMDALVLYIKSLSDAHEAEAVAPGSKTVGEYRSEQKPK
ncbi:MAG TPA: cytochrome c oxidase subunit II [Phycisphaerales bacterium]|nr:cytochrome c oxidase subunit II [Phycisphaerales bacterium]